MAVVGLVIAVLPAPGGLDAILLAVDNGPGFLVHEGNAALAAGDAPAVTAAVGWLYGRGRL